MSNEETYNLLTCELCGSEIPGADPRGGWYSDGESLTCSNCGAVNNVSCDGEEDPYINGYTCRHGNHSDDACDLCEIEDGCGVGDAAP